MAAVWPHSIRYGREVGTTMLVYIMGLAYAASSPIILPFALAFFVMSWCDLGPLPIRTCARHGSQGD